MRGKRESGVRGKEPLAEGSRQGSAGLKLAARASVLRPMRWEAMLFSRDPGCAHDALSHHKDPFFPALVHHTIRVQRPQALHRQPAMPAS
jgi:hypothetical protein